MPKLRWDDCVKRDVRKAGEEEDWKKKTRDTEGWKRLRRGGEEVADRTSTLTKGERKDRESCLAAWRSG